MPNSEELRIARGIARRDEQTRKFFEESLRNQKKNALSREEEEIMEEFVFLEEEFSPIPVKENTPTQGWFLNFFF